MKNQFWIIVLALCITTIIPTSQVNAAEDGGLIVTIVTMLNSHQAPVTVVLDELAAEVESELFPLEIQIENTQGGLEYATTAYSEEVNLELSNLAAGEYIFTGIAADGRTETEHIEL